MTLPEDAPAGPELADYRISHIVGRGGMGMVWRAVHEPTGVAVALKLVAHAQAAAQRVRREVRAMAALDHPHVIGVFDAGSCVLGAAEVPATWISMEWAAHGALLPAQLRSWDEVVAALEQVLAALAHAHAHGVLHRDVKPQNVLRTFASADAGLKLGDFGIAAHEGVAQLGAAGTPWYLAPEQAAAEQEREGPWTDLYAVGCLAWELCTGSVPYDGRPHEVISSHRSAPLPEFAPRIPVPERVMPWLAGLLAKDPRARFACAADAQAALAEIRGDEAAMWAPAKLQIAPMATTTWTFDEPAEPLELGPMPSRPAPCAPAPTWRPDTPRAPLLWGSGLRLLRLRALPVCGRHEERDQLWAALGDVARDGVAVAVALEGDTGVGVHTLATWLARRAAELGAADAVVVGPDGLRGALARALAGPSADPTLLDEALEALPQIAATAARVLQPDARRRADDVPLCAALLRHLGARRPVVLLVPNATERPLAGAVVRHLLRQPARTPVLAVLERPGAVPGARVVEVPTLPEPALRELLEHLRLGPALCTRVALRCRGNPMLAIQLVSHWAEREALVAGPRGYELVGEPEEPAALSGAWLARLSGLGDTSALEVAAVLGESVDAGLWEDACRLAGLQPSWPQIERAIARGVLVGDPRPPPLGRGFALAHPIARKALKLYAGTRTERWHSAVADALAPEISARRGVHLLRAGRASDARAVLERAVSESSRTGDLAGSEQLIPLLEQALEACAVPPTDRAWIHVRIAEVVRALSASDLDEAERALEQLEAIVSEHDERQYRARILALRARLSLGRGAREQAARDLDAARAALLRGEGRRVDRFFVTYEYVNACLRRPGSTDAVHEVVREALVEAEAQGIAAHQAWLWSARVSLLMRDRAFEAVRADALKACEVARGAGNTSLVGRNLNQLGVALRALGEREAAMAYSARAAELFRLLGDGRAPISELNRIACLLDGGQFTEAHAALLALQRDPAARRPHVRAGVHVSLCVTSAALGDSEALDAHLAEAESPELLGAWTDPDVGNWLERAGGLAAARGDHGAAQRLWRAAVRAHREAAQEQAAEALEKRVGGG